ncbi:unnamed protein product [Heligmosomoides polygyrus]|uniref:Complex1_LYR_dom domain-containing protein n=1 Tax=Heligmosomoides polygyrus TaxID=6339 RepID=A0A183FQH0_HELPZ|nr:unnamed protein product [Heligmosomoides polygyrus]
MPAAVAAVSRNRVLALYKDILKLARNWKARDAQRSLIERTDILTEAKETFREHKNVGCLILEGEKRLAQAQHYGIPYARPNYVRPQTAYSALMDMIDASLMATCRKTLEQGLLGKGFDLP